MKSSPMLVLAMLCLSFPFAQALAQQAEVEEEDAPASSPTKVAVPEGDTLERPADSVEQPIIREEAESFTVPPDPGLMTAEAAPPAPEPQPQPPAAEPPAARERAEDPREDEGVDELSFALEGYYRVRGHAFPGFFEDSEGWPSYIQHRLRLSPIVSYKEDTRLQLEIDAIDDVIWGDNASLASTSLFAGSPSNTDLEGGEVTSLKLNRVWMEFPIPVGIMRVGRQPSQWGLGLLANAGDGFDDNFGENHYGATYDRILFATRPLAVAQGIMGREDSGLPLFLVVGMDRLVEDPLQQYYGFSCEPGVAEGDEDYSAACDSDGDGVTDLEHGISDDERGAEDRQEDWWAEQVDDVYEMVYALIYKGDELEIAGAPGKLITGAYVVHRKQRETDSNVVILDYYLNAKVRGVLAQFEGLTIQGTTSAITLPGAYDPYGDLDNPLYKEADIWGYVGRLGWENNLLTALVETGYASGDDYVADEAFTGRPLHADFNAGLLIYEEILARVSAATWTEGAEGLWSKGGVYNSRYIFPQVTVRPMDNTEVIAGWLMAWPDKPDGSRILCAKGDEVDCAEYKATAANLGWEADLAIKHRWQEHMLFSVEAAYAQTTDRIPVEKADLNPDGRFFTLQSRVAYEF
jgi:hypothetical protein